MSNFHRCIQGNPVISCPTGATGTGAYDSLYGTTEGTIPAVTGNKVEFTVAGPFSGTIPDVVNNQITVLSNGVYTIHMDITASVDNSSTDISSSDIRFRLYINDDNIVPESEFRSMVSVVALATDRDGVLTFNTVGRTIQRRLNANDRLSIRIEFATGINPIGNNLTSYGLPSLVVTKIAE
jgi:hypothetical protein